MDKVGRFPFFLCARKLLKGGWRGGDLNVMRARDQWTRLFFGVALEGEEYRARVELEELRSLRFENRPTQDEKEKGPV
jgi:hypothetical protein